MYVLIICLYAYATLIKKDYHYYSYPNNQQQSHNFRYQYETSHNQRQFNSHLTNNKHQHKPRRTYSGAVQERTNTRVNPTSIVIIINTNITYIDK